MLVVWFAVFGVVCAYAPGTDRARQGAIPAPSGRPRDSRVPQYGLDAARVFLAQAVSGSSSSCFP